jgi:hypothetical protein
MQEKPGTVSNSSRNLLTQITERTGTRSDGMAKVIAALAAGYLGSTNIGSKANQILDDLAETQGRGGLEGLQLPDVKTLRGYLKQAQDR